MKRLQTFVRLTLLGGLAVVLPIALLLLIFQWLFGAVAGAIAPVAGLITERVEIREDIATVVALATILGACFVIGLFLKTRVGAWIHEQVDHVLSRFAPGYKSIRELVSQLLGGNDEASLLNGEVCLAQIFGPSSPVTVTAILTSRHLDGKCTVYVPTAPIPTSGMIYHLDEACVRLLPKVSVEQAMRTVVACGTGSAELLASQADTAAR